MGWRSVAIGTLAGVLLLTGCLRAPADEIGHRIGYAIDPHALGDDATYRAIVAADANVITTENHLKWGLVHPSPGTYDFALADRIVRFAAAHDQEVRGHVLVWHRQLPTWITEGDWTREQLIRVLRDHIHTVVGHYRDRFPGVVTQWDVVNEAFHADGTRRSTIFQDVIGDDYIELAFRFAHEADPDAELFYNDFYDNAIVNLEALLNGLPTGPGATPTESSCSAIPKCAATLELVQTMQAGGVPIDGVGFQAHVFGTETPDYVELTRWTRRLGIEWAVTELDIALPSGGDTTAALTAQADAYRRVVSACVETDNCDTTVIWGVSDAHSWLPGETAGLLGHGLLYDDGYRPKPALVGVGAALSP